MEELKIPIYTPDQFEKASFAGTLRALEYFDRKKNGEKDKELLTRKETAEKLKISLVTLNDWSRRGLVKSYTIGGRVFYKKNEIEESLHEVKTIKY